MRQPLLLPYGHSGALDIACSMLKQEGFAITEDPSERVTHVLLPVPSFEPDGCVKGGGQLSCLLSQLPSDITIVGGNLSAIDERYRKLDLLQDPYYVSQNAAITAYCAISLALPHLPCIIADCPVLVIGWGRIGKCLARLLRQLDADVTVAARKDTDRAMLQSLGYSAISTEHLDISPYRIVFNTAPILLLPDCHADALLIDLASSPGITGAHVIWARGLPGKNAPESSGELIAHCIAEHVKGGCL